MQLSEKAPSRFEQAGGLEGVERLVKAFYEEMDTWPQAAHIRQMHGNDLELIHDKLFCFLCSWLGGPALYGERYGGRDLPTAHAPFRITKADAETWLGCMARALGRMDYEPAFANQLLRQLAVPAERIWVVSRQTHGHSD